MRHSFRYLLSVYIANISLHVQHEQKSFIILYFTIITMGQLHHIIICIPLLKANNIRSSSPLFNNHISLLFSHQLKVLIRFLLYIHYLHW
jgi:hypothetical protein